MKKKIFFSALTALFIVGCGGGNDNSAVDNSGNNANNPILYTVYSDDNSQRKDKLLKTDGTASNTNLVSDIMIPSPLPNNFVAETISNFKIYGDYLYFSSTIETLPPLSLGVAKTYIYKTNLNTGTTSNANSFIDNSLDGLLSGNVLKYMETSNGLYFVYKDGSAYKIRKFNSSGVANSIDFNSLGNFSQNSLTGRVAVGDDIYFNVVDTSVQSPTVNDYKIVKFDTGNNIFTNTNLYSAVMMFEAFYDSGRVYFSGIDSLGYGIFSFDPANSSGLYTHKSDMRFYKNHITKANYIYNACYNTSSSNGLEICKIDTSSQSSATVISTNLSTNSFRGLREYSGEIFFTAGGNLHKLDGNDNLVTISNTITIHSDIVEANGNLYFSCADPSNANMNGELCKYDGSTVSLAADINQGSGSSMPKNLTEFNGELIFQAYDGSANHLYKYDGTTLTTLY